MTGSEHFKTSDEQMDKIQLGLMYGLTNEQIQVYATQKFNHLQMDEILLGFSNRLSARQVSLYANPKFNKYQMRQVRLGLEHNLSNRAGIPGYLYPG